MAKRDDKRRPRRRRSAIIDIANGFLALIVLGIIGAGAVLVYGANRFYAEAPFAEPVDFVVESGSSWSTTAARLEEAGLIENRFIFLAGLRVLKLDQETLQRGEFRLEARASMKDIIDQLTNGTPIQHDVTIPEGFTAWQVIDRLNTEDLLTAEITTLPAEGSILPQTYNYDRGATRQSVLDRMQSGMKEAVAKAWAECDPLICGPDKLIKDENDLVTLASIVEKETGISTERPQVAAVFLNRLRRGMRLQSDPTIIYGITKGVSVLGRDIRKSEIEAKNDYNTYQMDGLPAGPIANPGVDALMAVAKPAQTQDLYFVAAGANPSQGHLFAPTYEEHQRNVAKYRAAVRQAERDAEAQAIKDQLEADQAAKDEAPQ